MKIFVLFLCFFAALNAQINPNAAGGTRRDFDADFQFTRTDNNGNDVIIGAITGHVFYDSGANGGRGAIRWEYDLTFPSTNTMIIQIDDYRDPNAEPGDLNQGGISYIYCGGSNTCNSIILPGRFPLWYATNGAIIGTMDFPTFGRNNCNQYQPDNSANPSPMVNEIFWSGASPCFVRQTLTGSQIEITRIEFGVDSTGGIPAGTSFAPDPSWNCPQPVCTATANIHLGFDESGSISGNDFDLQIQFALDLTNAFSFGLTSGIIMGISAFNANGRRIAELTSFQNDIITALNAFNQRGGNTCLPCSAAFGLQDFRDAIPANFPVRNSFPDIFFVFTDGFSNTNGGECNSISGCATAFNNLNIIRVAIGVGSNIDMGQLNTFVGSSNPAGSVLTVASFSGLNQGFIDQLVGISCSVPPTGTCGAACNGFCACGQTCICPSVCNDGDICTTDFCNQNQNGAGCIYQPVDCGMDPCFNIFCDSVLGCQSTPVTGNCAALCTGCDDMDPCTVDSCNTMTNMCQNIPVPSDFCDDFNFCTEDTCVPFVGCTNTDISDTLCDDGNICTTDICMSGGCTVVARDCSIEPPFDVLVGDCQVASCDVIGSNGTQSMPATADSPAVPASPPRQPGCFLQVFNASLVDECGVCNGDGSTCAGSIGTGAAAGIGIGGLIAIIAVLAILALAGVFAGKKGYDYYQNNVGDLEGGNTNPAHIENPHSGQNQMYQEN